MVVMKPNPVLPSLPNPSVHDNLRLITLEGRTTGRMLKPFEEMFSSHIPSYLLPPLPGYFLAWGLFFSKYFLLFIKK